ncbi:MAG: AI-2E family transporter [Mesorhizobium sp.]|uniref:AI-2E family transporter n=1 Tax=Mesorhizobium sp. TaxID=1871066 RepID=UPI000FEA19B9|nr:AI-2E family transporter [Mesorhizobium sp.]RWL84436.1 MAG: AI-2E family transporter [Mesorhizobium sp.]RWL88085.1 MAG: AI-2E family transporter [Mesorhizobium sp.]RWL96608.1 MAG: AI-2E family transporter [Mesorhizobium sp.]TIP01025.1 MAG: AI-2E family transporter [Mesorhizobium sp.]
MNAGDPRVRHGRAGTFVLAAAAIIGIVVCVLLAQPFLGAITWALSLAILFAPFHTWIETKVKHPNLAAMISVLTIALLVAVPAAFLVAHLVEEAASGAASVRTRVADGEIQRLLEAHPGIAPIGRWLDQQIDLPSMMASLATWLSNAGATFVKGSVLQVAEVLLTFYMLFYFLRDRTAVARLLRNWMPLESTDAERLFQRVFDTVHATVYGTLAVAAVQGSLGGLMFWILGLPTPLFWGVVMSLLSVVPVLGSFIVWIPAAILLLLDGDWGKALILAGWGAIVVGGIDNLLRPMLVGNQLRLHTIPAFISMIGGLALFGAPGFILGPLSVTVTMLLVEVWAARYKDPRL